MQLMRVDWNKAPEIRWEKQQCPLCSEPTGPDSKCFKIELDPETDQFGRVQTVQSKINKTIELNGQIVPIFSEQCVFRRYSNFYINVNFPLTRLLCVLIVSIEGVEQFFIESKYRGIITIGAQFDHKDVQLRINEIFKNYVEETKIKLEMVIDNNEKKR